LASLDKLASNAITGFVLPPVDSLVTPSEEVYAKGCFFNKNIWSFRRPLTNDDFAGVVSVSFSAFDPFDSPPNQDDPSQGMRYRYVGLKHRVLAAEGVNVCGLKIVHAIVGVLNIVERTDAALQRAHL